MAQKSIFAFVMKFFLVAAGVWILHGLVRLTTNLQVEVDFGNFSRIAITGRGKERDEERKKVVLLLTDYRTGSTLLVSELVEAEINSYFEGRGFQ